MEFFVAVPIFTNICRSNPVFKYSKSSSRIRVSITNPLFNVVECSAYTDEQETFDGVIRKKTSGKVTKEKNNFMIKYAELSVLKHPYIRYFSKFENKEKLVSIIPTQIIIFKCIEIKRQLNFTLVVKISPMIKNIYIDHEWKEISIISNFSITFIVIIPKQSKYGEPQYYETTRIYYPDYSMYKFFLHDWDNLSFVDSITFCRFNFESTHDVVPYMLYTKESIWIENALLKKCKKIYYKKTFLNGFLWGGLSSLFAVHHIGLSAFYEIMFFLGDFTILKSIT